MTRALGVDYGTKRVGLALSDEIGLTAQPFEVVSRVDLAGRLTDLKDEYDIDTVVVGLPTGLSGHEGASALGARALGTEISELLGTELVFVDERFTSRLADMALLESRMRRRERKETIDKVAAAIILQAYLDGASSGNS